MGQVVHSLAKWKRQALKEYRFYVGRGLYTDMNAIRRDEELDNIHSIYVDQWDWEKVITREERTVDTLIDIARRIVNVTVDTLDLLRVDFPQIKTRLCRELTVIDSQALLDLYPDKTPKEREYLFTKEHKTVLIVGIGKKLSDGKPHDGRAPDYDDWDMNGDILFYDEVLDIALEISSMGVRVDEVSLDRQLTLSGCDDRRSLPFHRALLAGELPLTVGGGIGQSRLCMLMMGCAHIGEVQSSIWDAETLRLCREGGIPLL
jgi:aspartate--ammonia ligase